MKQLVPKNDKKRRKELTQTIEQMEADLKRAQDAELKQFEENPQSGDVAAESVVDQLEQLKIDLESNQMRFEESEAPGKMSKAEKRRAKKEREQLEREQRIAEGEKDNENHVRFVEINKLEKLFKVCLGGETTISEPNQIDTKIDRFVPLLATQENNLKLHDIASDGDCMYKAIEHQLGLQDIREYTVDDLRKLVAAALRKDKDNYLPFLTSSSNKDELMSDEEFERYCADMENTKKWGGNVELQIISKAISVNLHVYQADGPIIKFECDKPTLSRPLLISFHKYLYNLGGHYNSLVKTS